MAEFDYQPLKCGRSYRLVVVRKNISVQKGELVLFEDIKYFFYITNHTDYGAEQIVALANERCDQENVIEQLKNGVNAMRMPVDDLISNWAYMVHECLGLESESLVWAADAQSATRSGVTQDGVSSLSAPHCVVAGTDRAQWQIIYRIMGYNNWLKDFFAAWEEFALAPCHLAKQNDPDIHYKLCQQGANDAMTLPQSAPRYDVKQQDERAKQKMYPVH